VQSFAATGPKAIVLVARSEGKLEQVAASLNEKFPKVETLVVPTDVADPASVAALFEKVKSKYGHADVLVNNAAVFNSTASVKDVDHKAWWDEMVRPPLLLVSPVETVSLTPATDHQHLRHLPHHPILPQTPPRSRRREDHNPYHRRRLPSLSKPLQLRSFQTRGPRANGLRRSRSAQRHRRRSTSWNRGYGHA
jgi:hypothetical protein